MISPMATSRDRLPAARPAGDAPLTSADDGADEDGSTLPWWWHATYPDASSAAIGYGSIVVACALVVAGRGQVDCAPLVLCVAAGLAAQAFVWVSSRLMKNPRRGWTVAAAMVMGIGGQPALCATAIAAVACASLVSHMTRGGMSPSKVVYGVLLQLALHAVVFGCSAVLGCGLISRISSGPR